jgi:hypothetical protein
MFRALAEFAPLIEQSINARVAPAERIESPMSDVT